MSCSGGGMVAVVVWFCGCGSFEVVVLTVVVVVRCDFVSLKLSSSIDQLLRDYEIIIF